MNLNMNKFKFNYTKLQLLLTERYNKVDRQARVWKQISVIHVINTGLISRIYKECLQSIKKNEQSNKVRGKG